LLSLFAAGHTDAVSKYLVPERTASEDGFFFSFIITNPEPLDILLCNIFCVNFNLGII
jgi:hypothetical protein